MGPSDTEPEGADVSFSSFDYFLNSLAKLVLTVLFTLLSTGGSLVMAWLIFHHLPLPTGDGGILLEAAGLCLLAALGLAALEMLLLPKAALPLEGTFRAFGLLGLFALRNGLVLAMGLVWLILPQADGTAAHVVSVFSLAILACAYVWVILRYVKNLRW